MRRQKTCDRGKVNSTKTNYLSELSVKLIDRLKIELNKYLGAPRLEQKLAICCHPVVASAGIKQMIAYSAVYESGGSKNHFDASSVTEYKEILASELCDVFYEEGNQNQNDSSPSLSKGGITNRGKRSAGEACLDGVYNGTASIDREEDDILQDVYMQYYKKVGGTGNITGDVMNEKDRFLLKMKEEVDNYFAAVDQINWEEMVKKYPSKVYEKSNVNWTKFHKDMPDAIYICNQIDILKWWNDVGNILHPRIGLVASIIFGIPPSNGFQERIFSKASWFDGKLKQRLDSTKFELSLLDSLHYPTTKEMDNDLGKKEEDSVLTEDEIKKSIQFLVGSNVSSPEEAEEENMKEINKNCSEMDSDDNSAASNETVVLCEKDDYDGTENNASDSEDEYTNKLIEKWKKVRQGNTE